MCGFAGFIEPGPMTRDGGEAISRRMTETLRHRGPDDGGFWRDETLGVHLGFRRLAILDLSEAGHQPMTSASGRFVIVFNGEVYNHLALRPEISRKAFRGERQLNRRARTRRRNPCDRSGVRARRHAQQDGGRIGGECEIDDVFEIAPRQGGRHDDDRIRVPNQLSEGSDDVGPDYKTHPEVTELGLRASGDRRFISKDDDAG